MSKSSRGRAATQSFVLESPVTSNFFYLLYYFLKWCRNENGVNIPLCWFYRLLAFPFSNKNISQKFNLRHSVHQSVKTSNRPSKWNIIGVLWNKKQLTLRMLPSSWWAKTKYWLIRAFQRDMIHPWSTFNVCFSFSKYPYFALYLLLHEEGPIVRLLLLAPFPCKLK